MAPDQRYCLACGSRRGDPRLPFMDAVVFMEAMRRPQTAGVATSAPAKKSSRISPNASLVAGVATLILAIGVGVLIGRSGEHGSSQVANTTPQVITVEGGGAGTETASGSSAAKGGEAKKSTGGTGSKKAAEKKAEIGSSGASKATEEVLKPAAGVKLPPPTTKVGEKCEKGTAGCSSSGEFNGSFFGE
jgi:hypothetical protein